MGVMAASVSRVPLYLMLSMLRDDPTVDIPSRTKNHWTYGGQQGPEHWSRVYPHCGGRRQSPIDIRLEASEFNPDLTDFRWNNFQGESTTLNVGTLLNFTNSGHSASVRVSGNVSVDDGGLPGQYTTAEIHFHWGSSSDSGSEHAIDGVKYPLEMHLVNYANKYRTLTNATRKPDGLAIMAVLYQISERDNPAFEPLAEALQHIHKSGEYTLVGGVQLRLLMPGDTSQYYRYPGSLTTPHCYESVLWTVFTEPQKISERQLRQFRFLLYEDGHFSAEPIQPNSPTYLVDNWRPIQPLNGRVVQRSFPIAQDFSAGSTGNMRKQHYRSIAQISEEERHHHHRMQTKQQHITRSSINAELLDDWKRSEYNSSSRANGTAQRKSQSSSSTRHPVQGRSFPNVSSRLRPGVLLTSLPDTVPILGEMEQRSNLQERPYTLTDIALAMPGIAGTALPDYLNSEPQPHELKQIQPISRRAVRISPERGSSRTTDRQWISALNPMQETPNSSTSSRALQSLLRVHDNRRAQETIPNQANLRPVPMRSGGQLIVRPAPYGTPEWRIIGTNIDSTRQAPYVLFRNYRQLPVRASSSFYDTVYVHNS